MGDDDADLYGDLEATAPPQLPSVVELRGRLTAIVSEREALEAELQTLQAEEQEKRELIKDLTHRACVLIVTARAELKRKDAQLKQFGIAPPGPAQQQDYELHACDNVVAQSSTADSVEPLAAGSAGEPSTAGSDAKRHKPSPFEPDSCGPGEPDGPGEIISGILSETDWLEVRLAHNTHSCFEAPPAQNAHVPWPRMDSPMTKPSLDCRLASLRLAWM